MPPVSILRSGKARTLRERTVSVCCMQCGERTASGRRTAGAERLLHAMPAACNACCMQCPHRRRRGSAVWNAGGEGEIRTPDSLSTMPDFESGAFNRALPPLRWGELLRCCFVARVSMCRPGLVGPCPVYRLCGESATTCGAAAARHLRCGSRSLSARKASRANPRRPSRSRAHRCPIIGSCGLLRRCTGSH